MDNEKYELEKELYNVDKKLEKEKGKRNIIMVVLFSILCGFIMYSISGGVDTLKNFLYFIIMSIVFGGILYFTTIATFAFVTDSFTSITYLESRKSALEEKVKTIQNNK